MPISVRIVIAVIVTTLIGGFAYLLATDPGQSEKGSNTEPTSTPAPTPAERQAEAEDKQSGAYEIYKPEAVASTEGHRLLFFHAPWCPQCRELDASIMAGEIPDGVTIFKVDYDSNQALREQYGVTLQTSVVLLDDQGNEAKKVVPYDNPSLAVVLENLL